MSCNLFAASKSRGIKPSIDAPITTLQTHIEDVTHVVRRGESLSSIAGKYKDVTYQDIAKANNIANPNNIYVGQRLKIPNQTSIPKAPKTPSNPNIKPIPDETSTCRGNKDGCKKLEGYFYTKDGKYLGHYKTKNIVYIASSKITETTFKNPKKLNKVTHTEFQTISKIVKHEGVTKDKKEYLWIAHTSNNAAKRSHKTMYKKLMSSYSSVPKSEKKPLPDTDNGLVASAARAGVISVFMNDSDPTDGALFWDGTDFLAWGLHSPNGTPQNKFEEYSQINIRKSIYDKFLSSQLSKYPKKRVRYYGKYYTIPDSVFTNSKNWTTGNFVYNTGYKKIYKLVATGSVGRSIFWKIKK